MDHRQDMQNDERTSAPREKGGDTDTPWQIMIHERLSNDGANFLPAAEHGNFASKSRSKVDTRCVQRPLDCHGAIPQRERCHFTLPSPPDRIHVDAPSSLPRLSPSVPADAKTRLISWTWSTRSSPKQGEKGGGAWHDHTTREPSGRMRDPPPRPLKAATRHLYKYNDPCGKNPSHPKKTQWAKKYCGV